MEFENNFQKILGELIDPVLKLRLMQGGSSGHDVHDVLIWVEYDADLSPEQTTTRRPDGESALLSKLPGNENLERQIIRRSPGTVRVLTYQFRWRISGARVLLVMQDGLEMLRLLEVSLQRLTKIPIPPGGESDLQFHIIKNILDLDLEKRSYKPEFSFNAGEVCLCMNGLILDKYFAINLDSLEQIESGLYVVARKDLAS